MTILAERCSGAVKRSDAKEKMGYDMHCMATQRLSMNAEEKQVKETHGAAMEMSRVDLIGRGLG